MWREVLHSVLFKHLTCFPCAFIVLISFHCTVELLYLRLAAVENTDLEVLAEGFGADSTLRLSAKALTHQRPMWRCVAGSYLPVVAQQLVPAAELQVTHIAGKELNPYV